MSIFRPTFERKTTFITEATLNFSKCKLLWKKALNWGQKAFLILGVLDSNFEKLLSYLKIPDLGILKKEFENTIVIIEISALEFALLESLVQK